MANKVLFQALRELDHAYYSMSAPRSPEGHSKRIAADFGVDEKELVDLWQDFTRLLCDLPTQKHSQIPDEEIIKEMKIGN